MYTAMIVDDEYPARNMLDLLINWEENGFRIIAKAENGKQALEIWKKERPDLIITDIQMPVMDGLELIEKITQKHKEQSIVVLSCHESFSYAQQAIRLGVKDYLIKDMITAEQLRSCLSSVAATLKKNQFHTLDKDKIFSRNPDGQIQEAYPVWIATAESRIDLLQNSLIANDYGRVKKCISKLYQVPFEGLAKFHFLNWFNCLVFNLLNEQCRKKMIEPYQIFGEYEDCLKDFLLEAENTEAACALLCRFIDNLEKLQTNSSSYSIRIHNVIKYLRENYYYDISLQSVADHFGVHKVYLARTFKSETGETLNEYLNNIRIEKAKLLLAVTEDKVNDVALTVGFNNIQSFYNVFKKREGCSPNEYRKNYNRG